MLSIKNLTVTVENKEILHDISVDFLKKKVYAIMGVNGSGKSTLVRTIMGDPSLQVTSGTIALNDEKITKLAPHDRAKNGIFLSPQTPLAITGVTVQKLLRAAIPREKKSSKDLIFEIKKIAQELQIKPELLTRSLNENFSGGERKKMEILQAVILDPTYILLDEIDTGVDIDALKMIAGFLTKMIENTDKTLVIITHYNRILSLLPIDEVLVMKDGRITQRGDALLAKKIEKHGYAK
jgi:Fe-S cluster assembly ATP-binding protein